MELAANHAPKQKSACDSQQPAGDAAERHQCDAADDHGDPDEVALPWSRPHDGLSDDGTGAVGHQDAPSLLACPII
jgi:hypothetical protein